MCLRLFCLLFACALVVPCLAQDKAASSTANWYRGQGAQFEILIGGQVTEDGQRLSADIDLELQLKRNDEQFWSQVVRTQSGRYQCWVPVGAHPRWYSIVVSGQGLSGARGQAFATAGKLQEAIYDGLNLKLAKPTRTLTVKVTHRGQAMPGAKVHFRANQGEEILATDAQGLAHPQVCGDTSYLEVSAWTDTRLISPDIYRRAGTAEFDSNEFELELFACRSKKFVVKDQDGIPVPEVPLVIVSDRQLTDTEEQSFRFPPGVSFVSNAQGEIVNDWLPDLNNLKLNYGLRTSAWIKESLDSSTDPITLNVKKSKPRTRIEGKVEAEPGVNAAGLFVKLSSFQAEQNGVMEDIIALVDPAGNFSLDVLPGVTYGAFINDYRIVSEFQKFRADPTQATQPRLNLKAIQGVPIKVQVTQGPSSQPQAGARISVRSEFDITWVEDGRQIGGSLARYSDGFTNELGQVTLFALPGETRVSAMIGDWNAESKHQISADSHETVQFNRKLKGTIRGRVIAAGKQPAELAGLKVVVVSVDNHLPEVQRVKTNAGGAFEVESAATAVWALATTADEKFSGSEKLVDVNQDLVIRLAPTNRITGRLLDANERPLANREVEAQVVIQNRPRLNPVDSLVLRRVATTDKDGRYALDNLPCQVPIRIVTFLQTLGEREMEFLHEILFRDAQDQRPELKSVLGETAAPSNRSIADIYKGQLRDCQLNNYRLLVIIGNKSPANENFLNTRFLDDAELPTISACMPLWLTHKELSASAALTLREQHGWPEASDDQLFVAVYDGSGKELGRSSGDVRLVADGQRLIDLVKTHAPQPVDTQVTWKAALDEARQTNRRVWARIGSRSCGPCFRLTRWIDTHRTTLEKEFVLFKIDVTNDLNCVPAIQQINRDKGGGHPFHAIFAVDGQLLIDSEGPLGNIGHPGGLESLRHFRQMLETGCIHLNAAEIDELVKSLE